VAYQPFEISHQCPVAETLGSLPGSLLRKQRFLFRRLMEHVHGMGDAVLNATLCTCQLAKTLNWLARVPTKCLLSPDGCNFLRWVSVVLDDESQRRVGSQNKKPKRSQSHPPIQTRVADISVKAFELRKRIRDELANLRLKVDKNSRR
jgi:hypothetical protein